MTFFFALWRAVKFERQINRAARGRASRLKKATDQNSQKIIRKEGERSLITPNLKKTLFAKFAISGVIVWTIPAGKCVRTKEYINGALRHWH